MIDKSELGFIIFDSDEEMRWWELKKKKKKKILSLLTNTSVLSAQHCRRSP